MMAAAVLGEMATAGESSTVAYREGRRWLESFYVTGLRDEQW